MYLAYCIWYTELHLHYFVAFIAKCTILLNVVFSSYTTSDVGFLFLVNVNSRSRSLHDIARPSVCRL